MSEKKMVLSVRGSEKEVEEIPHVELYLEHRHNGTVSLFARRKPDGVPSPLLTFLLSGRVVWHSFIPNKFGFALNEHGQLDMESKP